MTRSWNVHIPSTVNAPTQDFATKNKMSIEAGANDLSKHKEFIKNLDVKKKLKYKEKPKTIDLPPENFVYGLANKPSTPIKEVINGVYSR